MHLLQSSLFSKDLQNLILAIKEGTALGVSNGSYMPHKYALLATAGWILLDNDCLSPSLCCGATQVQGQASMINAYWAKFQGLHMLFTVRTSICTKFNMTQGHITVGCDSTDVTFQMTTNYFYVPCLAKHADILCAQISTYGSTAQSPFPSNTL